VNHTKANPGNHRRKLFPDKWLDITTRVVNTLLETILFGTHEMGAERVMMTREEPRAEFVFGMILPMMFLNSP